MPPDAPRAAAAFVRWAFGIGLAWLCAGVSGAVWLFTWAAGQMFGGAVALLALGLLLLSALAGGLQMMVAGRLSEGRPPMAAQAWATGLGILLALTWWPLLAVMATPWLPLASAVLLVPQWVLHTRLDAALSTPAADAAAES